MASSGMLRRVARVRTDVSEELSVSFIRVTRICELGKTLAVTSNRRTMRRNTSFQNDCHSENLEVPGIEPETSASAAKNSDNYTTEGDLSLE
jgi:hypothetical protein